MERPGESAVTPVIGTILVLAITVGGMGAALYFGAPVIERLQDEASLRTMVGQLEGVRHAANTLNVQETSRSAGLSLPSGTLAVVEGPSLVVAHPMSGHDGCVLDIVAWSDGDEVVDAKTDGCGVAAIATATACALNLPPIIAGLTVCIEAYEDADGDGDVDDIVDVNLAARTNGYHLTLEHDLETTTPHTYRFLLVSRDATCGFAPFPILVCNTVRNEYAEAWLFRTNRVHWETGDVQADYAWGAVIAQQESGSFLEAMPRLDEAGGGGPLFLALPSLRGDSGGLSGAGSHSLSLTLDETNTRALLTTDEVLLELAGPLDEELCTGILLRESLVPLTGNPYTATPAGTECSLDPTVVGGGVALDDDYSVTFNPAGGADFSFTLAEVSLDASLVL